MNTQPFVLPQTKRTLRFREDGDFRILVITDIQQRVPVLPETIRRMEMLIDHADPSLVILGGDNGFGMPDAQTWRQYLTTISDPMESRSIPWCHVFGNHDSENVPKEDIYSLPRPQLMEIYRSFPCCMTIDSPEGVKGCGNCLLPVWDDDQPRFIVWLMDSHNHIDDICPPGLFPSVRLPSSRIYAPWSYFAFITQSQTHWYFDTSEKIEAACGKKIPGHMFFHIPLKEIYDLVDNEEATHRVGDVKESDMAPSEIHSGLFSAILERGDIKALFFGHDHANTFCGRYAGVTMGYCGSLDRHFSHTSGARLITVSKDCPEQVNTRFIYCDELMK